MTRVRAKRVGEALQGLAMELQEQEVGQHKSTTSPKLINLTYLSGDEVEDINIGPTTSNKGKAAGLEVKEAGLFSWVIKGRRPWWMHRRPYRRPYFVRSSSFISVLFQSRPCISFRPPAYVLFRVLVVDIT